MQKINKKNKIQATKKSVESHKGNVATKLGKGEVREYINITHKHIV